MTERRRTKAVAIGAVEVGGGAPVSVQSMTKTRTDDVEATLAQISELAAAGCDIVRVAVPDGRAAKAMPAIVEGSSLPVIADIHFNHELALEAVRAGVAGLRVNPGNIGGRAGLEAVAEAAAAAGIPIRVGANSGSLEPSAEAEYGHSARALVESCLARAAELEAVGFTAIKLSVKSSDVSETIEAYRMLSERSEYPLHLGVTEAGTAWAGTIKSSIGIGALLAEGIGDTVRVSLTASPLEEVRVGRRILQSLGMQGGPEVISCPTCGRCRVDIMSLATAVEERLAGSGRQVRVAVMGCAVNGPGEAADADYGIAGTAEGGVLFQAGREVRRCRADELVDELFRLVEGER